MKYLMIIFMLTPCLCVAETVPSRSPYDSRVRVIDYNRMDVVKLSTFYGVSTHVQFADDESIKDVAVGDDQAWNIVPRGNHLFIKPKARRADTNVTVITDKRVYNFALMVAPRSTKDETAWRDPNLVYGLAFRYPEEEAAKLAEKIAKKEKEAELKRRWDTVKSKFSKVTKEGALDFVDQDVTPIEQQNYDYWMAGSDEISPTAARDDGRFTYLAFSNNRDMPAVYSVNSSGKEALINTHVEGNTIIVHRVVPSLKLRKGDAVVCIRNNSFDPNGGKDNTAGTISPDIQRVVKERQ